MISFALKSGNILLQLNRYDKSHAMSEKRRITKATGLMGVATGLSRVAGLIRDMLVANIFGAGFVTDAFFMAFTIPNLLRRFFAEGSLTAAFVPTFSDVYHKQGEEEARRVASICFTLLFLIMVVVTVVGVFASPVIVRLIGYGFEDIPGKLALTDTLNRLMFPYIFFVSLLALVTGILNVRGHYFLPSFSPVLLNLSMIGCAYFLSPRFEEPILALAVGVLLGGLLQLLLQFPLLLRFGYFFKPSFYFNHPAVRQISRLMLPGIAGVAIYQINVVVTRLLASFLPEGSVSYLYYGQRLFEFPQGIIIASLAQAVLPAMSRQMAEDDLDGFKESLHFSFELLLLLILPATIGLMLCAVPVYSVFFMGGEFAYNAVSQSGIALMAYAPGLLCVGLSRVIVPAFYAMKDTKTPVWVSFWTLVANAGLGLVLMQYWAHVGLAVALTLASLFNAAVLLWLLRKRIGVLQLGLLTQSLAKILPAVAIMASVVWAVLQAGDWANGSSRFGNFLVLAAAVFSGGMVYLVVCRVFGVKALNEIGRMLRKKRAN